MKDNKSAYNAAIYDDHIVNVLPYYREYHGQVIDLVRNMGAKAPKWLDSGCGTGTLAARAIEEIPDAKFTLCDPSEKMLNIAKEKLKGHDIAFFSTPSDKLEFNDEFDVVTAIQSHHYFDEAGRELAVRNCHRALKDGGVFIAFENIRMSTDESDAIALKRWVRFLEEHGNSPEDVQMQIERRGKEVFPITIEKHIELLKKCGFRSVDLLWSSYLQAGFWAIK
ncbi:MAG: class I SAM-dependent methyltransferase [Lachnospiraceae bacterium]|nr:class I SAM-dependent methyltransferase [Lachnospiraceae bacterium]